MFGTVCRPDTRKKLEILSADAQYDLACACGNTGEGRKRGDDGRWIYPVTLPNGGKSFLFKTLMSNVCTNDCKYCPLHDGMDVRRCSLGVDEAANVFLDYYNRRKVFGLFLSSGLLGTPDATMDKLNGVARVLRNRHGFKGYIHLKIIPGASPGAIEEAVSLASAVSLNIETPGESNLAKLSKKKRYIRDIIEPMKLISRLTGKGSKYSRIKQTTQFVVGATGESDSEIVKYMGGLYGRLGLERIYFSAYQRGLGDKDLPPKRMKAKRHENAFVREHRLYQVDFLLRKYGFKESEIVFDGKGNLSLDADPKEVWAERQGGFVVDVNRGTKFELLRVPGLGPVTVNRILRRRKIGRIRNLEDIGKVGVRLEKSRKYLVF